MEQSLIQIKTILEFFKSKKTRLTALETLLGLTEIQEMNSVLKESETIKLTLRLLDNEDLTPEETISALHILVNLSSGEEYQTKFYEINATNRLARLFLSKVDKEVKLSPLTDDNLFNLDLDLCLIGEGVILNNSDKESQQKYEVNKILDKYVLNDKKNYSSLSNDQRTTIPYILMILNNLTVSEQGQQQLFASDKKEFENVKGLMFLKLIDKYFENIYKEELDFLSSVIANISALTEGRLFILDNKIYEIILSQFDKLNNFKIVNMLRIFRNCCFEFEKYENDLLVKDGYMLSLTFKIIMEANLPSKDIILNVDSLDSIHFTHFNKDKAKEERETINDLIVDVFVVLTNSQNAFPIVVKKGLKEAWAKVKVKLYGNKLLEDRLFVISNFLDSHS